MVVRLEANEDERINTCISTHANHKLSLPTRVCDYGRDERIGCLELGLPILRTWHRVSVEVNVDEERIRFGTSA